MIKIDGLQPNSVPYLLQRRAEVCPRDVAYLFPEWGQSGDWRGIWQEATQLAKGLLREGVGKGDKIAFLMTGRMELIVSMYAAACIGAILVPLNAYSRKDEVARYLREACPAVLFIGVEGHRQHYPSMIGELIGEYAHTERSSWLPKHIFVAGGTASAGFRAYTELLKPPGPEEEAEHAAAFAEALRGVGARDPLIMLFTSGTAGAPKAVMRTTASFFPQDRSPRGRSIISDWTDRLNLWIMQRFAMLNLLPLYHMGGFSTILTNLKSTNVRTVMLSRFHPVQALAVAAAERCRVVVGTPFMLQSVIAAPERRQYDLSALMGAAFTSAAVNAAIIRKVTKELDLRFFLVSYGSSEAGMVASGTCILNHHGRSGLPALLYGALKRTNLMGGLIPYERFAEEMYSLAGKVERSVDIRIVDRESGETLPPGKQGEIWIRSHRVMKYVKDTGERTSHTGDGWYRSGDLGWLDERRQLTIAGRMQRIISRGGEKISPVEIESVILRHKDVEDAFVLGVPDELYGEQICACIVPKNGVRLTAERLKRDLAGELSAFKLPRDYLFLASLPMSATGKVSIAEIKGIAMQELSAARRNA